MTPEEVENTQYVAITRPADAYGMPFDAFVFSPLIAFSAGVVAGVTTDHLGVVFGSIIGALAAEFIGFRALAAWSTHYARRIGLWIAVRFGDASASRFGGSATGPGRAGLPLSRQDIPFGV